MEGLVAGLLHEAEHAQLAAQRTAALHCLQASLLACLPCSRSGIRSTTNEQSVLHTSLEWASGGGACEQTRSAIGVCRKLHPVHKAAFSQGTFSLCRRARTHGGSHAPSCKLNCCLGYRVIGEDLADGRSLCRRPCRCHTPCCTPCSHR